MSKSVIKWLSAFLALLLIGSAVACLAEVERETVTSFYEPLDSLNHIVYTETWQYPIVDGQRSSGRPVGEGSYLGQHNFVGDTCSDCGYVKGSAINASDSYTTVADVKLDRGTPIDVALQMILNSKASNTRLTIDGVDAGAADKLIELVNDDVALEEVLTALSGFPAENIYDTDCRVVTVTYTDGNDQFTTENYAFGAADGALAAVY